MNKVNIKNIGWTLGNDCPLKCKHCYSFNVRNKGKDLTKEMVDRIIEQILKLDVETVNIGGNEPIFTNGLNIQNSLLPYILERLSNLNIKVGITTSGISLIKLKEYYPESLKLLNDVDVSIDSPFAEEHNKNRGGDIFHYAVEALSICKDNNIHAGLIMCAMNWNFTKDRIDGLIDIAKKYNASVRINILKPIEKRHLELMPTKEQIEEGYAHLFKRCDVIDLSEPVLAKVAENKIVSGCSCGTNSLRINSISPDGKIKVSPCVYMHDYRVGDLLVDDIIDIVNSKEFQAFNYRKNHYKEIPECANCKNSEICRGGCFAMAYTYEKNTTGVSNVLAKDPFCSKNFSLSQPISFLNENFNLVHQNYLCTCIVKPKKEE